jgi:2,3-diphosphopglycerate-independent phosphoglycerate mutase
MKPTASPPTITHDDTTPSSASCSKPVLLFVYGTLKRFQINYPFWLTQSSDNEEHSEFIGTAKTCERFPLFVASNTFDNCSPVLLNVPGEGDFVQGELFLVSPSRKALLDRLEGVSTGLYEATYISVRKIRGARRLPGCPSISPAGTVPQIVEALTYFRIKKFDEDWRASRPLLRQFRASQSLMTEPQTYRCLPAHVRFPNLNPPPSQPKPMVLVILDGVGDVQYASMGGRTPLQAACEAAPDLSLVTRHGVSGLMDPFCGGFACGSDTAHLSMLGYDPRCYYRGRGAFESLGAGMTMEADRDIAFKCNFSVTTSRGEMTRGDGGGDEGKMPKVLFRRCDRDFTAEGPVLCGALDGTAVTHGDDGLRLEHGPHTIRVTYATEHRCGVVITGDFLTDRITGTDPLSDGLDLIACRPSRGFEADARALYTSRVVMAASRALAAILEAHPINEARIAVGKRPANIVLLRGASVRNSIPEFERRHGLKGFMVAPTCIIRGLGMCCGLDIVDSEGGTGDYHSNILGKAEAVVKAFSQPCCDAPRYHFAVLHVKATDDAGHDGDPHVKVAMLQRSAEAVGYLWRHLPKGATIAITGDHTTICAMGDHTTEPVPVSIAKIPDARGDPPIRSSSSCSDTAVHFDEMDCAINGSLGRINGCDLIDWMKVVHLCNGRY